MDMRSAAETVALMVVLWVGSLAILRDGLTAVWMVGLWGLAKVEM